MKTSSVTAEAKAAVDEHDVERLLAWADKLRAQDEDDSKFRQALNRRDEDGRTLLHWAASQGDERMVAALIDLGGSVQGGDDGKVTPLHSSCAGGFATVARQLIDAAAAEGGDDAQRRLVRARTSSGVTALHYAAGRGERFLADILLQCGAAIGAVDQYGNAPLHRAVAQGQKAMIDALIQHGADVTVANKAGDTPMHVACENGDVDVVRLLLQHGGNELVRSANKEEKTPLDVIDRKAAAQLYDFLQAERLG